MKSVLGILGVLIFLEDHSRADTCPAPPNSIDPSVNSSVSYDRKSGLYQYSYTVINGGGSVLPIDTLIIQLPESPTSIKSPAHWLQEFVTLSHMPSHVLWGSVSSSLYKSVDVAPGQRLSGFSFKSARPPGLVTFSAQGRTGVPVSSPPKFGAVDDEPQPQCPDWDFESPKFKTLVTGLTTGPLPVNTVSVRLRLRDEPGDRSCAPINPSAPTGRLSVLILASKTFDPSRIIVSSVKFGPDEASPVSSKLIRSRDADDKDNEREDWEERSRNLGDGRDHNNDSEKRNLLLTFDVASLGVQCVLDKGIVLRGKTEEGADIVGGASTRLVGCDVRHPGRHRKVKTGRHGSEHPPEDGRKKH